MGEVNDARDDLKVDEGSNYTSAIGLPLCLKSRHNLGFVAATTRTVYASQTLGAGHEDGFIRREAYTESNYKL